MAHMITSTDNIAYVGEKPWHGLGNELAQGASIEDWQASANMAWRIKRAKVRYPVTAADAANPAAWREIDDKHVLVRSDNGDALGIVSDSYKVVQPAEVLEFFRDLTESAGYHLETAGTLFGGRRFWALASIGAEACVKDPADRIKGRLLLSTSADGTMATEGRYTTIRVVCNNTLGFARSESAPKVRVSHKTRFDAAQAKRDLGVDAAHNEFARVMDQMRELASVKVAPIDVVKATAQLIVPGFAEFSEKEKIDSIRRDKRVARVGELAFGKAKGSGMAGTDGTAYNWLQAVTEYVDHEARARNVDNRFNSAMFGKGEEMKQTALVMAMAMADGGTRYVDVPAPAMAESGSDDFAALLGRKVSIL